MTGALLDIAEGLWHLGNIAGSKEVFSEARSMAKRVGHLHYCAARQAKAGDVAEALATVDLIPPGDVFEREVALQDIVAAQELRGDSNGATKALKSLLDFTRHAESVTQKDAPKAVKLCNISEIQLKLGDKEAAADAVRKAFSVASNIQDRSVKSNLMTQVYSIAHSIGESAGLGDMRTVALTAAGECSEDFDKAWAYAGVAEVECDLRILAEAEKTALNIDEVSKRCVTLCRVSEARSKSGDNQGSRTTLAKVLQESRSISTKPHFTLSEVFARIVNVQKAISDAAGLRETFNEVVKAKDRFDRDYSDEYVRTLSRVSEAQDFVGDTDGAKATQDEIRKAENQPVSSREEGSSLSHMQTKARDGDLAGAASIFRRIPEQQKPEAFLIIAQAIKSSTSPIP